MGFLKYNKCSQQGKKMCNLKEALTAIKSVIPEAICISKASPQGGVYLLFDGVKQVEWKQDRANFRIIFATRSLMDDNFSALEKLDEIRERFIKNAAMFARDGVKDVKFEGFEESLFRYSFEIEVDIYRDLEDKFLGE